MAKEGFDWIWCDHALTVGYRSSLTEIVQIIGRATRDAPGKARARFTNLIAEPDASEEAVTEAVNDTLKAIAASLLMEQVLAPAVQLPAEDARQPSARWRRLWRRGLRPGEVQRRIRPRNRTVPRRDQGTGGAEGKGGRADLQRRPERGHRGVRPGQGRRGTRTLRRGDSCPRN